MRANAIGSNTPNGKIPTGTRGVPARRSVSGSTRSGVGSLVLMVVSDFYVLQHCDRIVGQDRSRAIERDQIGGQTAVVDSCKAHGKTRALLSCQTRLEEADDTLLALSHTDEEDLRFRHLTGDMNLVGRNQGKTAPCEEWAAEESYGGWWNTTARAFTAKGCDGARMCKEEGGSFHTFVNSSSRSSGVGEPFRVEIF
jgi:hypothetical protein